MKYIRLILGLMVIILLISLMIYCSQEYAKNDPHIKKCKVLFQSSDYYNNTEISFLASIYWVNKTNHTLRVEIEEQPYRYPYITINTGNIDIQNLKKGDLIDVIGVLNGKNRMTATKLWLDEPWKTDLIYLRSLPAVPFVLYLFFRTWKFNTTSWRFERRKKNA
jgi:hypothetical protein